MSWKLIRNLIHHMSEPIDKLLNIIGIITRKQSSLLLIVILPFGMRGTGRPQRLQVAQRGNISIDSHILQLHPKLIDAPPRIRPRQCRFIDIVNKQSRPCRAPRARSSREFESASPYRHRRHEACEKGSRRMRHAMPRQAFSERQEAAQRGR